MINKGHASCLMKSVSADINVMSSYSEFLYELRMINGGLKFEV